MTDVAIHLEDRHSDGCFDYYLVRYGTPAQQAICDWARFHGLDPMQIPSDSVLIRDAERRRICYAVFLYDEDGKARVDQDVDGWLVPLTEERVEQGEAPPLPFPPEITTAAREVSDA